MGVIFYDCITSLTRYLLVRLQTQIYSASTGWIEQKGMTFGHNFVYSFPLFSSPLKKREEEKEIDQKGMT